VFCPRSEFAATLTRQITEIAGSKQPVRDGDEIRRAAERDRQAARDRGEHPVDRVLDLERPRFGRAEEASAEDAQLASADRDALGPSVRQVSGASDGRSAPLSRAATASL
jgi:hypothetical protein